MKKEKNILAAKDEAEQPGLVFMVPAAFQLFFWFPDAFFQIFISFLFLCIPPGRFMCLFYYETAGLASVVRVAAYV